MKHRHLHVHVLYSCKQRFFAQVSFSDQNLSFVHHCCFCHCCCCKLLTFYSSSLKPLGQFQPNLTQSILGWSGLIFFSNGGPCPFARVDNKEIAKIYSFDKLEKDSSPEPHANFNQKWHKALFGGGDSNLFKWRATSFSKGR